MVPLRSGWVILLSMLIGFATAGADPLETSPETLPTYVPASKKLAGSFSIVGSGVMTSLIDRLQIAYYNIYHHTESDFEAPSSAPIPAALLDGKISIGAMSRPMSQEEKQAFVDKYGYPLVEICLAHDALVIVVNRANPLAGITLEQLDGIYSNQRLRGGPAIKTWGDLGVSGSSASETIKAFGGGAGWGTTMTFERLVTQGAASRSDIFTDTIEEGIPADVAREPYAIGYTCLGTTEKDIKAVPVALKSGDPFIASNPENLRDGSYPLIRDLYLYVAPVSRDRLSPVVAEFLRFVLSKQGQAIVAETGMIPLTPAQADKERAKLALPTN